MAEVVAEFIGTFFLVAVGVGSILGFNLGHQVNALAVDVAFAGAIGVGVYAFGHVSGGHFNPSVTLGLYSAGVFPGKRVVGYLLAQLAGASLASLMLKAVYGTVAAGVTSPSMGQLGIWPSLLVEFAGTYLLVSTVYGTAVDERAPKGVAGVAIGGAILLAGLMAGAVSGGSVNPARSFGPALVSGNFHFYWIYVVAPILGGIAAANVYRHVIVGRRP